MALDAAQILRQTYASGAERIDVASLMRQTEPQAVARGELMGTAVVLQEDPMAELMDSMEELSFQFEEKTAKRVAERRLGEMQGPRSALVKAIETWMSMMPDMPGRDFITRLARGLRSAAGAGNLPDARELLKELARGSTDSSHQFAMLDILEQAFGVGEEELQALVRQAKAALVQEKGPEIRAGINLAEEVNARRCRSCATCIAARSSVSRARRTASVRFSQAAAPVVSPTPFRSSSPAAARILRLRRPRLKLRRSGASSPTSAACIACSLSWKT